MKERDAITGELRHQSLRGTPLPASSVTRPPDPPMASNRYLGWEGLFAASADEIADTRRNRCAAGARRPFPKGAYVVKVERLPVQRPLSERVPAVADDEAAPRDRLDALRVAPRNHFVCAVCGRTLMTGERAQRQAVHGHEAEVVCELCQRQQQRRRGSSTRGS